MRHIVYRFSHDLRLDDHAGLHAAAQFGSILPVLVIDRALRARVRASPRRAAFFCACVERLNASLVERGARLIVVRGEAGTALRRLCKTTQSIGVAYAASYDRDGVRDDEHLQSVLEEAGLRAVRVHDAPAVPPEETAAEHTGEGPGYRAFVPYFQRWLQIEPASYEMPLLLSFFAPSELGEPLAAPEEFHTSTTIPMPVIGAPRDRLAAFLRGDALAYAMALGNPADDRTSHLSSDLSFGTISARTVVRETLARAGDPFLLAEERASLRRFLRALAMRDFMLQLAWFSPQTFDEPLQEKMHSFRWARTHPALDAWREGRTGFPLVDAGIRQLHATGWMHPRVRAVAASFLCFDLGVEWRTGRDEWDRHLVEDDLALATGNWQWIAGVGADMAQYPRIYNPTKQGRRFDPQGAYVRRYVPELAHVPPGDVFGERANRSQLTLALFDGNYPSPVVDHDAAARVFLARYGAHARR